eukprot:SAG31_NODE_367_length_16811_cov_20.811584_7_plen_795_part_00
MERFILNATVGSCAEQPDSICYWRKLEYAANSTDGRSRLLLFNVNGGFHPNDHKGGMYSQWDELAAHIQAEGPFSDKLAVQLCHESMLLRDAKDETIRDFEMGDGVTLPLAWAVLMFVVGPPGLLVLLTLPMSLLISFCINAHLAAKAYGYHFASFSPSIFISMLVALNNDFALFILVRFQEEAVRSGATALRATVTAVRTAGRVVCVSGVVLCASFGALRLVEMELIQGIGVGGAVCVASAVLVNLTLLPAILVLGAQMSIAAASTNLCGCHRRWPRQLWQWLQLTMVTCAEHQLPADRGLDSVKALESALLQREEESSSHNKLDPKSFWLFVATLTRSHRVAVVVATTLLAVPCGLLAMDLRYSIDQSMLIPRDSESLRALRRIESTPGLSAGGLVPIYISMSRQRVQGAGKHVGQLLNCSDDDLDVAYWCARHEAGHQIPVGLRNCRSVRNVMKCFDGDNTSEFHELARALCPGSCPQFCRSYMNASVFQSDFWEATKALRHAVIVATGLPKESVSAMSTVFSTPDAAAAAMHRGVPRESVAIFNDLVNAHRDAALLRIRPRGAFSASAVEVMRRVRIVAGSPAFAAYSPVVLAGGMGVLADSVESVYAKMPILVAQVIGGLLFVLVGLAFCSLLIPIRLLLTVVVTVGFTASALVLIFQVVLNADGIYWIVPVCTTPLVIGLTLDYDLFVVSRVHEYRCEGFSTESAVIRAVVKTGPVISAAGFIMVTAFSSMLLSNELVLNQFGCALVTASIVDTVLVRSFFVPALMQMAVEYVWWPARLPPVIRHDIC